LQLLLVEDNPGDAELVRAFLEDQLDHELLHAPSLQEATDLLSTRQPDLILLDMGLPDSRGIDTLHAVQRYAPEVPSIILTGREDDELAMHAMRSGAQEYLPKQSMSEELLVRTVRHSVERHELLRETQRQAALTSAAERELRTVLMRNVDGMLVVDTHHRVLFSNPAAQQLLGTAEEHLAGQKLPFPVENETNEISLTDPGGETRVLEVRIADIDWQKQHAHLVSLRDITSRRRAEEMRRQLMHSDRLRSVGELAAGIAHEINNPVASVLANSESLESSLKQIEEWFRELHQRLPQCSEQVRSEIDRLLPADEASSHVNEGREIVQEDRQSLMRIRSMVRSLRAFSRIERDEVEWVRLDELVHDACTMASSEIRHRAQLIRDLETVSPIAAQPGKLTQVFVNLLVNAGQAIHPGAPSRNHVRVRTQERQDTIVVDVEDTGRGVPEAEQRRIFEPFYTSKPRDQGTGLGLSLSAEIARQHHGRLEVSSTPGHGALFRVVLPRATGLSVPARSTEPPPITNSSPRRRRLLVVDDEPLVLKALRRALAPYHDVVTARGGREAADVLRTDTSFDAVVCDLMMPDFDGSELYRWLENHAPGLCDRFVVMSGGAVTDESKEFLQSSGIARLDKPVAPDRLRAAIQELCEDDN
jgi:signal transduction histidine kinase